MYIDNYTRITTLEPTPQSLEPTWTNLTMGPEPLFLGSALPIPNCWTPRGASKWSPQGIAKRRSALLGTRESSNLVMFSPFRAKEINSLLIQSHNHPESPKTLQLNDSNPFFVRLGPTEMVQRTENNACECVLFWRCERCQTFLSNLVPDGADG